MTKWPKRTYYKFYVFVIGALLFLSLFRISKFAFRIFNRNIGVFDGAEVHESVLTLLALDRAGAEIICMPNRHYNPKPIQMSKGHGRPQKHKKSHWQYLIFCLSFDWKYVKVRCTMPSNLMDKMYRIIRSKHYSKFWAFCLFTKPSMVI